MRSDDKTDGTCHAMPDDERAASTMQPCDPTAEKASPAIQADDRLKPRTKALGLRVIRLVDALPKTTAAQVVGRQVLRSALSVGANYRAACRARSRAEFISRMGIVEEESDETHYWLEILADSGLIDATRLAAMLHETSELTAMVVASIRTARKGAK